MNQEILTPNHLLQWMQQFGPKWFSIDMLAEQTCIERSKVTYMLIRLKRQGLIRKAKGKYTKATFYAVNS